MLRSGYTAELAVRGKKSEGKSSQQVKTPEGGSESSTRSIVRSDGMDSIHRWLQVYFAVIYSRTQCARLTSTKSIYIYTPYVYSGVCAKNVLQ